MSLLLACGSDIGPIDKIVDVDYNLLNILMNTNFVMKNEISYI